MSEYLYAKLFNGTISMVHLYSTDEVRSIWLNFDVGAVRCSWHEIGFIVCYTRTLLSDHNPVNPPCQGFAIIVTVAMIEAMIVTYTTAYHLLIFTLRSV